MAETYGSIKKHLIRTLEHVEVLNDTDISELNGEALAEISKLVAILNRRFKRLCDGKADHLKGVAFLQEGLMIGQRLRSKEVTDAASFNETSRLARTFMDFVKDA